MAPPQKSNDKRGAYKNMPTAHDNIRPIIKQEEEKNPLSSAEEDAVKLTGNKSRKAGNSPTQELSDQEAAPGTSNIVARKTRSSQSSRRSSRSGATDPSWTSHVGDSRSKKDPSAKASGSKNLVSKLKKSGPLGFIFAIIFGGGVFFYAAQSILAPHLINAYTQATDLQYTVYNLRSARLMSYILDGGSKIKISNFTKKYTFFSPALQNDLAKNGIEVGHLNANGEFEAGQAILGNKTVLRYGGKTISADSFQDEYVNNASFRDAYSSGRASGFYDESSDDFYSNWPGATNRNTLSDYTGEEGALEDTVNTVTAQGGGTFSSASDEETTDDGEYVENGDRVDIGNLDGDSPEAQARSLVNGVAGKISSVGVPICSALRLVNIINVAISATQVAQSIAYFLTFAESINKMMSGEGGTSGVNETLNFLTKQTTTTVDYVDESGKAATRTVSGSALQSAGAKMVLGKTASSETEVQPYTIDSITEAANHIIIGTGTTTAVCSGVMASSAIISLTTSSVPGGNIAVFAVGTIARIVGGIAMTGIIAAIVNAIVPRIAKMFTSDIFETYNGIPAGELFSQGAAAANFALATKGSAYAPSSEEAIKTQNRYTTLAIAQEAEVDRLHHGPFDATNPNTFLGSLLSKFSYAAYSNTAVNGAVSIASAVGSSIRALIPGASAYDQEAEMYTSQNSECPNAKGIVCDMYSHPIPGFDYSTIDIPPDDPTYQSVILPNLNDDGSVKKGSELAKYISFCSNRESPIGVDDANIRSALHGDAGIIAGSIPYVGELYRGISNLEDIYNRNWINGKTCYNSPDNPRWESEIKYYQLFVADMRGIDILNRTAFDNGSSLASDPSLQNPVLTYQKQYRAEHPQDNSFRGTLSRITGLSMDDIAFLLEYIDYSNEIANYDPSTRLKFAPYQEPEPVALEFVEPTVPTVHILSVASDSIFVDRRNYAV